jgi:hypothetical protein
VRLPWVIERYPQAARRQRAQNWYPCNGTPRPAELDPSNPDNLALFVELLRDWRALFAPGGLSYTSLNRTLMNLPGGITPGILRSLASVRLERPIFDRLELMTIGTAAQKRRRHHDHVYAHARHDEIVQAMAIISEGRARAGRVAGIAPPSLSPRRTRDVAFFTGYLSDFPELHSGRIVGLARKAVAWHLDEAAVEDRRRLEELGLDRRTALPPVPLPEADGVRFLSTVGEGLDEGRRMQHCVASYARDAVYGHCYLFHVDHAGEEATVEVDRTGRVLQSYGRGNSHNVAASRGRQTLGAWGSGFRLSTAIDVQTNLENQPSF